jgi:hypothetical protein
MRRVTIVIALAMLMSVLTATAAIAHGPTCSDFEGLGVENHGQHVLRDYVMGEADNAKGGAILPGGPGPGYHFPNGFAPGASFCTDSQSPGIHV